jgi:hypothetical protein
MELNFQSMESRMKIQITNTIEQCIRAPNNTIKHKTLKKWKKFNNYKNLINNNNNFHENSIFTRAIEIYNEINDNENNTEIIDFDFNKNIENKFSLPSYIIQYPNNLFTFDKIDNELQIKYNNNNNIFNWYTDGSVANYYGGYSFSTFNERNNGYMNDNAGWIKHFTNIDHCELIAIYEALNESIIDDNILKNDNYKFINIYTDSIFCIYSLAIDSYPKYEFYYNLVQKYLYCVIYY